MASLITHTPSPRTVLPPTTISSNFSTNDSDDDNIPLPFPAALPRSDFLAPTFHPAHYLSSLPSRHQTLEDLRADLRERSAAISSELLELVNSNYTAFLSLGTELRGGDDKVEDVRVALLSFRRAVEDVKGRVGERRVETERLNRELKDARAGIEKGRTMIEISDRLSELEERLTVDSLPGADDVSDEDDEDEVEGLVGSSPTKVYVSAHQCRRITALIMSMDQDQPFVIKQEERLTRCRNTLLLDLNNALKEAKAAGTEGHDRVMKYLGIYRIIDAEDEAVKALRRT